MGARYISTSDYKATRDDEHSFVTGAVVKLLKKHIDGWWLVGYRIWNGVDYKKGFGLEAFLLALIKKFRFAVI